MGKFITAETVVELSHNDGRTDLVQFYVAFDCYIDKGFKYFDPKKGFTYAGLDKTLFDEWFNDTTESLRNQGYKHIDEL